MGRRYILGLTGSKLRNAQIWAVILPAYLGFGWNNAVAGPLLDLSSWVATFPAIDTVHPTGAEKTHHSTIQGTTVAMYTLVFDLVQHLAQLHSLTLMNVGCIFRSIELHMGG
jgi:hypothetical protein